MTSRVPIGQILVRTGLIDAWQLQSALGHQRRWGGRIGEALVRLKFVTEPVLMKMLARQHEVPYVEIADLYVPPEVVQAVPAKLIRARKLFPIAIGPDPRRGPLVVATSEPQNLIALDEVAFAAGKLVKAVLASDRDIEYCIERYLGRETAAA